MNKTAKAENLFLKKKRQESLEKKLNFKFIRIYTSDAKRDDTDYQVSKIQIFISKFKENKIKEQKNKIKELEDKIKKLRFLKQKQNNKN